MSIATGYPWDGPIFRPGAQGESLEMLGGPAIFLSVQALDAEPLSQPETQEHAWDKLRPLVLLLGLSMSANGCSNGRNRPAESCSDHPMTAPPRRSRPVWSHAPEASTPSTSQFSKAVRTSPACGRRRLKVF